MMRKEKKSRKAIIMAIVIAAIMIFSVMGIILDRYGNESSMNYNGHTLERKGSKWALISDKKEIMFDYFPSEVESINISEDIIKRIGSSLEIDSTYDLNSTNAEGIAYSQFELNNAMGNQFNIYVRIGFTGDNEYGIPIITCSDSTPAVPVIYFIDSNETLVRSEGSCIIAEGKGYFDFIKIKDRILYGVLGVIG